MFTMDIKQQINNNNIEFCLDKMFFVVVFLNLADVLLSAVLTFLWLKKRYSIFSGKKPCGDELFPGHKQGPERVDSTARIEK